MAEEGQLACWPCDLQPEGYRPNLIEREQWLLAE